MYLCNFGDIQNPKPHENLLCASHDSQPLNGLNHAHRPNTFSFTQYSGPLHSTNCSYHVEERRCTVFECVCLWKVKEMQKCDEEEWIHFVKLFTVV